jgi:hypothetical protein
MKEIGKRNYKGLNQGRQQKHILKESGATVKNLEVRETR